MGSGFDLSFQKDLSRESWSLYGVGMFLVALRIYARIHRVGLHGFQIDDYLMLVSAALYTMLVVCLNVIAQGGGSNLFPLDQLVTFTPDDIQERIKGSKIVLVSEQAMLNVIYTIKACMLLMYGRLTMGLHQQRAVKLIAVYVALGWVATELAFFLTCRPFKGYWAVPPPNPQCTTLQHYAITQATFNISSDILMLAVMLPLLSGINLPLQQKLSLLIIFSMGSFVIAAAILTKVFNLSNVYSTVYMLWYVRESSTAIYVSNIPLIWPLLREWFPYLRNLTPGWKPTSKDSRCRSNRVFSDGRVVAGNLPMSHMSRKMKDSQYSMGTETDIERSNSKERINRPPFEGFGILKETTVDVDIEDHADVMYEKDDGTGSIMMASSPMGRHNTWERMDSYENSEVQVTINGNGNNGSVGSKGRGGGGKPDGKDASIIEVRAL